jgi:hypothetical protein
MGHGSTVVAKMVLAGELPVAQIMLVFKPISKVFVLFIFAEKIFGVLDGI